MSVQVLCVKVHGLWVQILGASYAMHAALQRSMGNSFTAMPQAPCNAWPGPCGIQHTLQKGQPG